MTREIIQFLLGIALTLVVVVLGAGIIGFGKGSPWYERNSNNLMRMRAAAQAVAVLLLGLLLWLAH